MAADLGDPQPACVPTRVTGQPGNCEVRVGHLHTGLPIMVFYKWRLQWPLGERLRVLVYLHFLPRCWEQK